MITTADTWHVYSVQWLTANRWETPYIGACPSSEFSQLPDANRNSMFRELITVDETIIVTVLTTRPDRDSAEMHRADIIAGMPIKPHFNVHGVPIDPPGKRGKPVPIRAPNGTLYESIHAAARALNVTPAAVAKHLRGDMPTVGGLVLERVTG